MKLQAFRKAWSLMGLSVPALYFMDLLYFMRNCVCRLFHAVLINSNPPMGYVKRYIIFIISILQRFSKSQLGMCL